jgi:hypothetical protein
MTETNNRLVAASYQAAQSVVGWTLRIDSFYSTIDGTNGEPGTKVFAFADPRERIAMLYAGCIAVELGFGYPKTPDRGDAKEIDRIARQYAITAEDRDEIWIRSESTVRNKWAAIQAVAAVLVERGSVLGVTANSIRKENDGKAGYRAEGEDDRPPPWVHAPCGVRQQPKWLPRNGR